MKKRVLITMFSILVVAAILSFYRGSYWLMLSRIEKEKQHASNIFQYRDIPIVKVDSANLFTMKIDRLEFKHNMGNPINQQDVSNAYLNVEFSGKRRIVLNGLEKGTLSGWGMLSKEERELISKVYGPDIVNDDYDLLSKSLELAIDDFKWLSLESKNKLEAKQLLYDIKITLPNSEKDVFYFKTKNIKGFQRGIPEQGSTLLHIFDNANSQQYNYEIMFAGDFTQKDIDIIIQSIKIKKD